MDKYLLEILKQTNTIIIPGLGALTITNEDTGEIMFMPYLKHEDGNLAEYIAKNEGWEENDAKNLIAKYVRDIKAKLEKGEEYSMYQFGTFVMQNGDIEFVNWNNETSKIHEIMESSEVEVNETEVIDSRNQPNAGDTLEVQEKQQEMLDKVEAVENSVQDDIESDNSQKEEQANLTDPSIGIDSRNLPNNGDSEEVQNQAQEMLDKVEEIEVDQQIENQSEASPSTNDKTEESTEEINIVPLIPVFEAIEEENDLDNDSVSNTEEEIISKDSEEITIAPVENQHARTPDEEETVLILNSEVPDNDVAVEEKVYYQEVIIVEKKRRGAGFWLLLVLLFLLIGGGTYVALNYDQVKSYFIAKNDTSTVKDDQSSEEDLQNNETIIDPNADTTVDTTSMVENMEETNNDVAEMPIVEESVKTTNIKPNIESVNKPDAGTPYHVIGGAFMVKSNADNYAQKLANDGNPSVIVGRFDSLYLVSIKSFPTSDAAKSNLGDLQSVSTNAWVFKWP